MVTLTNAQIELLELFKQDLKEGEMQELKRILLAFKAQRTFSILDTLWETKGWTKEAIQSWAKEHNRTPYHSQNVYLAKHYEGRQKRYKKPNSCPYTGG